MASGFSEESREKARLARAQAAAEGRRPRTRREKMADHATTFAQMRRDHGTGRVGRLALPLIAKAEKGSLTAVLALNCLDCSGWVRAEVRDCVIVGCPFYPHRPYQKIKCRNPNDPPA